MANSKSLDQVIAGINKKFGEGTILFFNRDIDTKIDRIPTQSIRLNRILSGGIPRGRITEIYGAEHSGKSSLAYGIIAEVQKMGGKGALIDLENAFEPDYAQDVIGIDLYENFLYVPPCPGEQALDIIEALVLSNEIDVLVVDSVASIAPQAELEADMAQQTIGLQARLMSKAMRKLSNALGKSKTALIFINQERIDVKAYSPHGAPTTTPGGKALRFYASVRIEVRRGQDIKEDDTVIGHQLRCLALKNRGNFPKQRCAFDIIYGKGIDNLKEVSELAVETGLVTRAGAWLSLVDPETGQVENDPNGNPYRWQGMNAFVTALREDQELYERLKNKVLGLPTAPSELVEDE